MSAPAGARAPEPPIPVAPAHEVASGAAPAAASDAARDDAPDAVGDDALDAARDDAPDAVGDDAPDAVGDDALEVAGGNGPDQLAQICASTREEVARRRALAPEAVLRARIEARGADVRPFAAALGGAMAAGRPGLIAELKRASPSAGVIRPEFDPATLARAYEAGGAACLSVLTEGPHFGGDLADLERARAACTLPVLRKDFILDAWQVLESRAIGADCILLIMAALDDGAARALARLAHTLGLDVLVEVHDRAELDRALALDVALLGINNRNLRTLRTDLAVSAALAPLVPPGRIVVSESGIRTHADIERLGELGIGCFLVGESLLRQADVAAATRRLLGRDA